MVVPTHQRRALLELTLRSVLAQTGVDLRVVVVDEASRDGTAEFLRSIPDPRVSTITHATAQGATAARNAGLGAAASEWVAFCDDDDLWAPTKLAAQHASLRRDPRCHWSCVGAVWVDARLRPIAAQRPPGTEDLLRRLLVENVIPGGGSGVVMRTELLRELGGFATEADVADDWDLWIRLAERSPLAIVGDPLVAYRVAPSSVSQDTTRMEQAMNRVRARHRELARTLEVEQDPAPGDRYLATIEALAGRRVAPARRLAGVARRERRLGPLIKALVVLGHPRSRLGPRRLYSRLIADRRWLRAAEQWIATFRGPGD